MSDDGLESLLENLGALSLSSATDSEPKLNRTVLGEIPTNVASFRSVVKQTVASVVKGQANAEENSHTGNKVEVPDSNLESESASDQFDIIRELDEKERWSDRNIVITSLEHEENKQVAVGILDSIIEHVATSGEPDTCEETSNNSPSSSADPAQLLDTLVTKLTAVQPVSDLVNFDPLASGSPLVPTKNCRNISCTTETPDVSTVSDLVPVDTVPDVAGCDLDEPVDTPPSPGFNRTFDLCKNETFELPVNPLLNVTVDLDPETSVLNKTFICEDSTLALNSESTSNCDPALHNGELVSVCQTLVAAPESSPKPAPSTISEQAADSCDRSVGPIAGGSQTFCEPDEEVESKCSDSVAESELGCVGESEGPPLAGVETECQPIRSSDSADQPINVAGVEATPFSELQPVETVASEILNNHELTDLAADTECQPIRSSDSTDKPINVASGEASPTCEIQPSEAVASEILNNPILVDFVTDLEVKTPGVESEETNSACADKPKEESHLYTESEVYSSGVVAPSREVDNSEKKSDCQQGADQQSQASSSQASVATELVNSSKVEPILTGQATVPVPLPVDDQPLSAESKMADEEDIPIPRGAYTINWDEIDEFADPFAMSKPKGAKPLMAASPPIRSNACPPSFDTQATSESSPGSMPTAMNTSAPVDVVPEKQVDVAPEKQVDVTPEKQVDVAPEKQVDVAPEKPSIPEDPAAPDAPSDDPPPKKKSPIKKKKVAGKPSSRLAEFKKKQASKLKAVGGGGDAPDLTLSIPPSTTDAIADDDRIPPPASYDFDNCDDPFGSKKNKMASSPPIRAQPVAPVDFESVEDPFGTKSKMAVSPTSAAPSKETAAETAPPAQFADPVVSKPAAEEPISTSDSASPFMSSAKLSSPAAVKVLRGRKREDPRLDSPAKELSSATNGSHDDDFEDAVDELPADMFKPAVPAMFNTTADLGVLDRVARMKPSFRESSLANQSLYQKFDPLVSTSSPGLPTPTSKAEESVCLIGEFDATKVTEPEPEDVDRLLDITVSTDHDGVAPPKYTQDEMDELQESLKQLKVKTEAQRLEYEAQILEISKQKSQLEEMVVKLEEVSAQYANTVASLIEDKEKAVAVSDEAMVEIKADRDKYAEDLASVESSFTDLHKRYNCQRETIEGLKKNEAVLRQKLAEEKRAIKDFPSQMELMKTEFNKKLRESKAENEKALSTMQGEKACMEMAKRKAEIAVESLNQQLGKKSAEIAELTRICDSLIAQLKGGS